jgi:hypothetical protein
MLGGLPGHKAAQLIQSLLDDFLTDRQRLLKSESPGCGSDVVPVAGELPQEG